ncbi:viral A-type inclusion protein [Spirosoma sp. HMF3257]|uniref:Viral A-type inclusion protein n=1 Tax=Spirosoma telluris TaxID=2183553 RepID=A0A327NET6_9BACT|nr:viral A-type inclusion protein [Spirosoma telluris]RAI73647.1 viral A-type inclusion protein [Spirosoma telluris]
MNKTTRTLAILIAFSGIFWACNSGEEEVKQAENEVFAIHDEIMPKVMGDLVKLKKQLNKRVTSLDSLKASGSAAATLRVDEDKEQAIRLKQNLLNADSLMTVWMATYNGDTLAKLSSDKALNYLAAQKDILTDVKKKVNTSIEQAKQYLGKN